MVCSRYSAAGTMNDCQSGGRGFELVSGTLIFVDMKISGQHDSAGCSRALLATLSPSMFFFVLEIKMQIHC